MVTIREDDVQTDPSAMALEGLILAVLVATTGATFLVNVVVLVALTSGHRQPLTRTFAMTLTVSMVTADMLISVSVMPVTIYSTISGTWVLGDTVCRIYCAADIMLCTASIFHLAGLACDRYLAVCRPFFHRGLTLTKARLTCALLWLLSAVIAFGVVLPTWQVSGTATLVTAVSNNACLVRLTLGYVVASVVLSFFLPLGLIVGFNLAILTKLRSSAGNMTTEHDVSRNCDVKSAAAAWGDQKSSIHHEGNDDVNRDDDDSASHDVTTRNSSETRSKINPENYEALDADAAQFTASCETGKVAKETNSFTCTLSKIDTPTIIPTEAQAAKTKGQAKGATSAESSSSSRLKPRVGDRAIKTILWLVSCFVVCWFPFFAVALVVAISPQAIPKVVGIVVLWLGYINSTINPFLLYRFNCTIRGSVRRLLRLGDRQNYSLSS